MDLTLYFRNADELAAFCMLQDNDAQDAALAIRTQELAQQGVAIPGMQCEIFLDKR